MFSFSSKKVIIPDIRTFNLISWVAALTFLLSACLFFIFYLSSGYDELKNWFYSLNGCFINRETWTVNFFTPLVKSQGNNFALAGILFSMAIIIYLLAGWKKLNGLPREKQAVSIEKWGWYFIIVLVGLVLGIWSWHLAKPANDEIFSAVYCADIHPLQALTYYMAPNNHIYFNILNNFFFHWSNDHLSTGRFISLLAYICVLLCAFNWISTFIRDTRFAFVALLPIALQLSALGFAAQARGYEAQLLCGWVAFTSMLKYNQTEDKSDLKVNTVANIAGFAMIPTYFFWYIAQVVTMSCIALYNRRFERYYWVYQVLAAGVVFLLYAPAICFSGLPAFNDNVYVKPAFNDWIAFLPDFAADFKFFINFCFSLGIERSINYVVFFVPFLLFFSKKRERRFLAFFYFVYWTVFIVVNLVMRHAAFNRNLILHYSITMALFVYTIYVLVDALAGQVTAKYNKVVITLFFAVPLLGFCQHLIKHDKNEISTDLYFNNVTMLYKIRMNDLTAIPTGSSVAFSYNSFYFYYYCRKLNYNTSRCPNEHEDYYVNLSGPDPLPAWVTNNYQLFRKCTDNFEIYKRK